MPRKEFEAFTRLDASDVNTYLMDQSVMTFAGTAARGSAITTPVEGMVTYLEDSDAFEYWDSAEWTSLAPAAPSGNAIINGAFEINQRGFTSSTANLNYGFDRWRQSNVGGTATVSTQTFTLGAAPVTGYESSNFARVVTSGQSATSHYAVFQQLVESVRTFAGQTVTISFFAKAASGTPKIGVAMTQNFGTGGSPSAELNPPVGTVTLSTSWVRYSLTYNVPSISGKTIGTNINDYLGLELWVSAGSNFATRASSIGIQNNTFDIWGVQLESGPTANAFRRNANSLQGELAACQRYYFRSSSALSTYATYGSGMGISTTSARFISNCPVQMRIAPTSVDFANISFFDGSALFAASGLTIDSGLTTPFIASTAATSSGITNYRPYFLITNNLTTGFVGFSAEL
jgi:hypothetical protein